MVEHLSAVMGNIRGSRLGHVRKISVARDTHVTVASDLVSPFKVTSDSGESGKVACEK